VRFLFLCFAAVTVQAADFQELFANGGDIWKLTPAQFMAAHRDDGFRWQSASKTDLARSADESLRFAGLHIWEAKAGFDNGTLRELTLSLYNRGDAGGLLQAEFEKLLADTQKTLTDWCAAKGIPLRQQERTTTITVCREVWVKGPHRLDLTWSFTPQHSVKGFMVPFRPEFVRLVITKFDPANVPRAGFEASSATSPTRMLTVLDFRARVKREPNGDVYVSEIPMVNQGQKGYCAAAVMERVLRYFGRNMDQHELAQMANTSSKGTTSDGMSTALQRMAEELRVNLNVHQRFSFADFEKLIADYNRLAKTARKPEIIVKKHGEIKLAEIYEKMDTALLRQARLRRDAGKQQFKAAINKYVNTGCPLVWTVFVGKVTETPPIDGQGGHMRLIIGFNDRKDEVLYSDTWGARHELKRMPLTDAWTITFDLFTVEPRDVRF